MKQVTEIYTGTVRFYNDKKGYGFIFPDDSSKDIFFHATGMTKGISLESSSRVSYKKSSNKKGDIAIEVDLLP